MTKYTWKYDKIMRHLKDVDKMLENNYSINLYADKEWLEEILEEYFNVPVEDKEKDEKYNFESPTLIELYYDFIDDLAKTEYTWHDVIEFSKICSITPKNDIIVKPIKYWLSKDDILDLTYQFYKDLDPVIFKHFNTVFKKRKENVHFINNCQFSEGLTYAFSNFDTHICIKRNGTLEDVLTSIHEFSHATSNEINHNHLSTYKDLYSEIDSIFMEIISTNFLKKHFNPNHVDLILTDEIHNYMIKEANFIATILKIHFYESNKDLCIVKNKELKKLAQHFKLYDLKKLNFDLEHKGYLNYTYLPNYIFALELYHIYKKDPQLALNMLKKIIKMNKFNSYDYYNEIINLGLIPNEHAEEFHQQHNERIKKLLINQKKNISLKK